MSAEETTLIVKIEIIIPSLIRTFKRGIGMNNNKE